MWYIVINTDNVFRVGAIFAVISNEILHSKLDNVNEQGPVGQMKTSLDSLVGFASVTAGVSIYVFFGQIMVLMSFDSIAI